MAMTEYKYQEVTHDQLLECIKWCQNKLQLRDWQIKLDTRVCIPKELKPGEDDDYEALASISKERLRALLWVPLVRLKQHNCNPIEATIHEMCHVMVTAREIDGEDESLTRTISPLTYQLYCKHAGFKIAKEK